MAEEIEVKCKLKNVAAFRKALERIGARPVAAPPARGVNSPAAARVHEMNDLFDTPKARFAKHRQLVRVRVRKTRGVRGKGAVHEQILFTYKGPARQGPKSSHGARKPAHTGRHKVREEVEVEVTDDAALKQILRGMGLRPWFRYEKYRTTYCLPARQSWARGLLIELDETPVGNYVELEGPAEAIDKAAALLGFRPWEYITKSYLQIYLKACRRNGTRPGNMLFGWRR
jgi:adenylate cyclase class IV